MILVQNKKKQKIDAEIQTINDTAQKQKEGINNTHI